MTIVGGIKKLKKNNMKYFVKANTQTVENIELSAPYFFNHNSDVTLTAGALKAIIKDEYTIPPSYVVKEDVLKVNDKVVTNDFVVPFKSNIKYTLTVIDPSVPVPSTPVQSVPETSNVSIPPASNEVTSSI